MSEHTRGKVWVAKVGYATDLPNGADFPMREVVAKAFKELTGSSPEFIFSGWGGALTESELAVVEEREPGKPCARCMASGKIANSDDGEPWPFWEELPEQSKLAIHIGLVRPIPCPECKGAGTAPA